MPKRMKSALKAFARFLVPDATLSLKTIMDHIKNYAIFGAMLVGAQWMRDAHTQFTATCAKASVYICLFGVNLVFAADNFVSALAYVILALNILQGFLISYRLLDQTASRHYEGTQYAALLRLAAIQALRGQEWRAALTRTCFRATMLANVLALMVTNLGFLSLAVFLLVALGHL